MKKKPSKIGRPRSEGLTSRQRRTLKVIEKFVRERGLPPTMQELGEILGIKPASVHDQISQLVTKGYLQRDPGKARGLTLTRGSDEPIGGLVGVPIVGDVVAGYPVLAEENIEGEILVDESLTSKGPCFGLRVKGNSMKHAGIHDGDLVIARQQPIAERNEVVIALVDGESTIKRLYIQDETIELRPDNPRFRAIRIGPDTDLRIVGKVVAVKRVAKSR